MDYYDIQIVGMRKKRDLKIVVIIIILAIIGIIASIGVIASNKASREEVLEASTNAVPNVTEEIIEAEPKVNTVVTATTIEEEEKASAGRQDFVEAIDNIYNGTEGKRVFLTFDDGPTREVTPKILDVLKAYDVKATFFVLGNRVKANPDILKRAYDEGHYIANHSYSHQYSSIYKSVNNVLDEYNKTEDAIRAAIGDENYSSNLFRFPGGAYGGPYEKVKKKARAELKKQGIAYLDWSALTYDAEGANTEKKVLQNLKETMNGWNNVVILMHDAADKCITYESLEDVIKYLQKEGYAFKNIYDLM